MPAKKVHRDEVVSRLLKVFRTYGYEGASLAIIAKEVGLQKASLYHLFPDGKEQMAKAVLESAGQFFEKNLLTPLRQPGTPLAKVEAMIAAIREFYHDGRQACLFEALTLGDSDNPFRKPINKSMREWQSAMSSVAVESGFSPAEASRRAERVLVLIQGALVVSRIQGEPKAFARALEEIPETLLRG